MNVHKLVCVGLHSCPA